MGASECIAMAKARCRQRFNDTLSADSRGDLLLGKLEPHRLGPPSLMDLLYFLEFENLKMATNKQACSNCFKLAHYLLLYWTRSGPKKSGIPTPLMVFSGFVLSPSISAVKREHLRKKGLQINRSFPLPHCVSMSTIRFWSPNTIQMALDVFECLIDLHKNHS